MEPTGDRERLQCEIAAIAARMIVEEGRDFAQAKRKAAAAVAGDRGYSRAVLPDNEQIDAALRAYLRTVVGAPHRARLRHLRDVAVQWMQRLERFCPYLVGAVLDGSATQYCPLTLNLYTDSAKDVEMALLERGVDFRVAEAPGGDARAHEVIGFLTGSADRDPGEPAIAILLTVYDPDALRIAPSARARNSDPLLHPVERCGRASLSMLRQLLNESDGASDPMLRA